MPTLEENKKSVIEEFSMFDDWLDKYECIIDMGKELNSFPDEKKTSDNLIKGCQSRVWLDYEVRGGRLYFSADSDAVITRGIIALLIKVYSGQSAEDIASDDFSFVDVIGMRQNLSPTRAGGLNSMIETIKSAAKRNI